MSVVLYTTSVSSNSTIKANISRIKNVLTTKKIVYTEVDISLKPESKDKMRTISGDSKKLPPVICNGDEYCGDYEAFDLAVEDEKLNEFLKLK